jgi:Cu/Ag efflux protein CusF
MKYKRVLIYTAFLTAVVILVTAQTTKPMEEKSNEKCPQFLYTEKEIDKISA